MYKFIYSFLSFFLVLIFAPTLSPAQINLNSTGQVGIGTSPTSTIRLQVNDALGGGITRTAIQGLKTGGADTNIGVSGIAKFGWTNYGIYGSASGGYNRWAGYFNGSVYTTGSYQPSDERLKKNITAVNAGDMLSKIGQLKPVHYQFLSEAELRDKGLPSLHAKEGNHIGLLAQNVEEIFPELVINVVHPLEDEQGEVGEKPKAMETKAINYQELTVALLAAVQELKAEVETLKAQLNKER